MAASLIYGKGGGEGGMHKITERLSDHDILLEHLLPYMVHTTLALVTPYRYY